MNNEKFIQCLISAEVFPGIFAMYEVLRLIIMIRIDQLRLGRWCATQGGETDAALGMAAGNQSIRDDPGHRGRRKI